MTEWRFLLDPAVREFVAAHEGDDVAVLALKKPQDAAWNYPLVLDQIKARQAARTKLPSWLATKDIVFPIASVVEQASSEITAQYKASLVGGKTFSDLTAGAGADFVAFLKKFESGIAVEKDQQTAEILAHNLSIFSPSHREGVGSTEPAGSSIVTPHPTLPLRMRVTTVINAPAEGALENLPPVDFIFLDPARRNERGKGRYRLEDGSPDVISLLPALFEKAPMIMLKTSPVLDVDAAAQALKNVAAVHVIEWRGACREVLYCMRRGTVPATDDIPVTVAVLDEGGAKMTFTRKEEQKKPAPVGTPEAWLFEPSPAFMKAGCFNTLAARFDLRKLHPSTHLFTAPADRPGFPGRAFVIEGVYPGSGKGLNLAQANLAVRNFPAMPEELRRKLKLKDGGDDYLFACTLADGKKAIIRARKKEPLAPRPNPLY